MNARVNDVWIDIVTENIVGQAGDWEVLLVGDVCYDKELADMMMPWLRAEQARGCKILFGDPGRFYLQNFGLRPIAGYTAITTGIMEDSDLRNARVWVFDQP